MRSKEQRARRESAASDMGVRITPGRESSTCVRLRTTRERDARTGEKRGPHGPPETHGRQSADGTIRVNVAARGALAPRGEIPPTREAPDPGRQSRPVTARRTRRPRRGARGRRRRRASDPRKRVRDEQSGRSDGNGLMTAREQVMCAGGAIRRRALSAQSETHGRPVGKPPRHPVG